MSESHLLNHLREISSDGRVELPTARADLLAPGEAKKEFPSRVAVGTERPYAVLDFVGDFPLQQRALVDEQDLYLSRGKAGRVCWPFLGRRKGPSHVDECRPGSHPCRQECCYSSAVPHAETARY